MTPNRWHVAALAACLLAAVLVGVYGLWRAVPLLYARCLLVGGALVVLSLLADWSSHER